MQQRDLNGAWTLTRLLSGETFAARVPGSVYEDLLRAGKLDDPFWRDNENRALPLMDEDYEYARSFPIDAALLGCARVLLRCEGLDTVAHIRINGRDAGYADNMHRIWEFDVKALLHEGENRIAIRFSSPTRYIKEAYARERADGSSDAMTGFPLLRKAHCMFGWDWGPRLPDMGVWRAISLVGVERARILSVLVRQRHEDGRVRLQVQTELDNPGGAPCAVEVCIEGPQGERFTAVGENMELSIDAPALWWPNGLGAQPLYTVRVSVRCGDAVEDVWQRRIGLRRMDVERKKDAWGESFTHSVNGQSFFAMGADYIPEDNLLGRVTPERTRRLLTDAAAAHCNVIRVWGGGYYPDDYFYDICDELGLVVWQDCMFACAVYNLTPAFEANVRAEIADNVRRLRHHASLGLWCGNNEMEEFVAAENEWLSSPRQKADYIKLYEYIIPGILAREDPDAFYWPASPSSGGSFDEPNDENRGDVHYWAVWHGLLPFTDYRNHLFRYVSEFGFQSFPCMKTIESFTLPEDRNVFSYVMEKHQRNASANGRIVSYLSQMYLYPRDLPTLVYASQLLQAQAMQYGVEHWRRHRGRCMGAVIWQLNDCWPVASWSSIDYYGRWKALHYYMKRFFAPVLLSCEEEGVLDQNTNVNAEPFALKKSVRLCVQNESPQPFSGTVRWQIRTPDAAVLKGFEAPARVEPFGVLWLDKTDCAGFDTYAAYCSYELVDESGAHISGGSVLFCPPKHFRFADARLTVRREGDEIVVSAAAYARAVEILSNDADAVFSDNYFDMDAGSVRVKLLRGAPTSLSARSVYDIR